MSKFLASLAALAFVGCATTDTASRIKEPERSEYYFMCLRAGIYVTTCACMEEKAVKDTGITSIDGEDPNSEKVKTFIGALQGAGEQCAAETQKAIDEGK